MCHVSVRAFFFKLSHGKLALCHMTVLVWRGSGSIRCHCQRHIT